MVNISNLLLRTFQALDKFASRTVSSTSAMNFGIVKKILVDSYGSSFLKWPMSPSPYRWPLGTGTPRHSVSLGTQRSWALGPEALSLLGTQSLPFWDLCIMLNVFLYMNMVINSSIYTTVLFWGLYLLQSDWQTNLPTVFLQTDHPLTMLRLSAHATEIDNHLNSIGRNTILGRCTWPNLTWPMQTPPYDRTVA